ncbi:unnamed protein product [Paramecium sonneborni]|uniref:Uncharacterized protein n=1 Tax=Paramecium sonneborni TaxID=65129 RepID=A0A8S1RRI8_9CILI|nr:unnamed protein product [Paramecium sonneborni]
MIRYTTIQLTFHFFGMKRKYQKINQRGVISLQNLNQVQYFLKRYRCLNQRIQIEIYKYILFFELLCKKRSISKKKYKKTLRRSLFGGQLE